MGPGKVIIADGNEHMSLEKVLIVEDNADSRANLKQMLSYVVRRKKSTHPVHAHVAN
jgi:hypoxanthine phosphoribosyltransferase